MDFLDKYKYHHDDPSEFGIDLKEFKKNKNSILITFGGAFSNHLLAVAYLGKVERIETLAIVRGEELKNSKLNSTLKK